MLLKKNRADKKTVERIFKEGRSISSPSLTFKFILGGTRSAPRVSFVAPKSVAKLANKRNFLRRRGYSALKNPLRDLPPGLTGVFVFKKFEDNVSILENEIKTILKKIY